MPRPAKTEADYKLLAEQRGFEWLGPLPRVVKEVTTWRCSEGHVWETTYDTISGKRPRGCPECGILTAADLRRKKPEDYSAIATINNMSWLGPVVEHVIDKTNWTCARGHTISATYNHIQSGKGCRFCADQDTGERSRLTRSHYEEMARKKGVKWIGGNVPALVSMSTSWKCECGAGWDASYTTVKAGIGLCPGCAKRSAIDNIRIHEADYRALAEKHNCRWIGGSLPDGVVQKTLWRGLCGHEWQRSYNKFERCPYCPKCQNFENGHKFSRAQKKIAEIFGGTLNYRMGKRSIDIAVFVGDFKMAIEYDCWYWHGSRLKQDEQGSRLLIENGWRVLRIKTGNIIPEEKELKAAFALLLLDHNYIEIVCQDWGEGPYITHGET